MHQRRGGRRRIYKNRAECDRAYRERRKQREKTCEEIRGRLHGAAQGQIEPGADVAPICALIKQGCDLEADILPTVPRTVPELPRRSKTGVRRGSCGKSWRRASGGSIGSKTA
jgi:hypothetical protein